MTFCEKHSIIEVSLRAHRHTEDGWMEGQTNVEVEIVIEIKIKATKRKYHEHSKFNVHSISHHRDNNTNKT